MKTRKFLMPIVMIILHVIAVYSQSQNQWEQNYETVGVELASCVIPLTDGGYLLGGSISDALTGNINTNSVNDYQIIKVDVQGNKDWKKSYGGSTFDNLSTVIETGDGGFLLAGHSTSSVSGDKSEPSRGGFDYWVVKTDENGIKQWDKTFGGLGNEQLFSVVETSDGGYILGGTSNSEKSELKNDHSRGENDFWVVKIDSEGNKQWDKAFGGAGDDQLRIVKKAGNGGFILGGYSNSGVSLYKSDHRRGAYDYWVIKIDTQGRLVWDKTIGGQNNDYLQCVEVLDSDEIIAGGYSYSKTSADKESMHFGGLDIWVVKLSDGGTILWENSYGSDTNDKLCSLVSVSDGNILVNGFSTINNYNNEHFTMARTILLNKAGFQLADKNVMVKNNKHYRLIGLHYIPERGFIYLGNGNPGNAASMQVNHPGESTIFLGTVPGKEIFQPDNLVTKEF